MKTYEQAHADAGERAMLLGVPYVIFRDSTAAPPFAFGCCSAQLWDKANPTGMLVRIGTIYPVCVE